MTGTAVHVRLAAGGGVIVGDTVRVAGQTWSYLAAIIMGETL